MSYKVTEEVTRKVVTTEPSYKMATNYYPDIRMQNQGRETVIRNRSIDGNQSSLIERRKRQNIPTSPNEEVSYYQRTERSEMIPTGNSRRRSQVGHQNGDISQQNYSRVNADRSISQIGNAKGAYGFDQNISMSYQDGGKLRAKQDNSSSVSGKAVGTMPDKQRKPFYCRLPFLCLLGFLALLGLGAALFFLLKGNGSDSNVYAAPTPAEGGSTNLRTFYDAFDSPNIITQQTTIVQNSAKQDSNDKSFTVPAAKESEKNLKQGYKYSYYLDEQGIRRVVMVPINSNIEKSSNVKTVKIGDYSYTNPLKDRMVVMDGQEKPVTITQTTETEIIN